MSKTEHTPTPWFLLSSSTRRGGKVTASLSNTTALDWLNDKHYVGTITGKRPDLMFVERAVNAHDALVKTVAQYLKLFGVYSDPKADKLHARARDVLALAKGE